MTEPDAAVGAPAPPGKPRRPPPKQPPRRFGPPQNERQRRFRQRAIPLALVALISFAAGVVVAAGSPQRELAERFVDAWAQGDFRAMYAELSPEAQSSFTLDQFREAYEQARVASTATAIEPGKISGPASSNGNEVVTVEVGVRTNAFGLVQAPLVLPLDGDRIGWDEHLAFPGLRPGERVGRRLELGKRASILAADGTPLAQGDGELRSSPLEGAAIDVVGRVGEPSPELAARVQRQGYPGDEDTGVSGLELAFNDRLAGKPGGQLLAVPEGTELPDVPAGVEGRVLARSEPAPARSLRTTIDPDLQEVSVAALAGRPGGIAVLNARTGAVKALAGSAFSSPQPPGSTFKVVTTVAGLEQGEVKLDETFPIVEEANAGGRVIANAHKEPCGGTFVDAFALSCNTVFAPLGVEVGEQKLVEVAESFGWNQKPTLYDARATAAVDPPEPTIPEDLGDSVDLAVSSIGQGEVLATPLNMASVAQTIANGGMRKPTPLVTDPRLRANARAVRVTSRKNARIVRSLMEAVVTQGTGAAAALSGVRVAGKTGTAELGPKPNQPPPEPLQPGEEPPEPEQIVDAWFIAFAPAQKPKLAVAVVLLDADGDGGEVAAPVAAQILASGL